MVLVSERARASETMSVIVWPSVAVAVALGLAAVATAAAPAPVASEVRGAASTMAWKALRVVSRPTAALASKKVSMVA